MVGWNKEDFGQVPEAGDAEASSDLSLPFDSSNQSEWINGLWGSDWRFVKQKWHHVHLCSQLECASTGIFNLDSSVVPH